MRTHYCGQVDENLLDQTVSVCGWVHRRRDHGGVIFIDLRDRVGLLQVVIDPDTEQAFATAERVRSEYVLRISGRVRERPEGTVNSDLPTGRVEVLCKEIDVAAGAFVFYTDRASRKGDALAAHAFASLVFHFAPPGRQVRASGPVVDAGDAASDAYFGNQVFG